MTRNPYLTRRLSLESLENRTLLSVTVLESEPNNDFATANVVPLPRDEAGRADALLKGSIASDDDHDRYQLTLEAGDVPDIYPYPQSKRLNQRFPQNSR